jgi:hypothetical protein
VADGESDHARQKGVGQRQTNIADGTGQEPPGDSASCTLAGMDPHRCRQCDHQPGFGQQFEPEHVKREPDQIKAGG